MKDPLKITLKDIAELGCKMYEMGVELTLSIKPIQKEGNKNDEN